MITQKELLDFVKSKFIMPDNISEDTVQRDLICMEARASLLIEANCTSERFPAFMKGGRYTSDGWIYQLSEPYVRTLPFPPSRPFTEIIWTFQEFMIDARLHLIGETGRAAERWKLYPQPSSSSLQPISSILYKIKNSSPSLSEWDLTESFRQLQEQFNRDVLLRYWLCSQVSPYKTPEEICRFWGNEADVFAKLKLHGMWPDRFHQRDSLFAEIGELLGYAEPIQVFPFWDQYGENRMQLAKYYDPETQSKVLIPITSWMQRNCTYNQLYCVPSPEDKQPLYNLDLLLNQADGPVILTDSVELAEVNQSKAPDDIVFTSFLCSPGRYEQVDWTPLQDKDEIWYLVTNHSDISLEAAYIKAQELADFLRGQYDIRLKFIQMKVDYPSCHFKSVDMLQKMYREQPPKVNSASVVVFENDADFDIQHRKAVDFIHSQPPEWWEQQENASPEEKRIADKESKKRIPPSYLLRPFLLRGEASMLYASKSTGKSALALSMAAAVVSGESLFFEKWWTVPKIKDDPFYTIKYLYRKVLYLDFENGKEEIKQRKIDFAYPYWPPERAKREECNANLIIEDMSTNSSGKDYSDPENWPDIMRLLEAAKHQGIDGQPVDLLVIDTLTKFTRKPYTTTLHLSDFINKLRSLNLAILFVHHEGSNGEVRGWRCGLDDVYFNLRLYREADKTEKDESPVGKCTVKDLDEPLILAYHNARSGIEKIPNFEVRFEQKWQEHYRENDPDFEKLPRERRLDEFGRIVEHYLRKRLDNQDIYPLLGISKDTFYKFKRPF